MAVILQNDRCKAHIPNIDALNSDTHTLRIQYEYTQKQCVGVAIEGMDIWYMGLICPRNAKIPAGIGSDEINTDLEVWFTVWSE